MAAPDSANEVEADQVADAVAQGKPTQQGENSGSSAPITGGPVHRKTDPAAPITQQPAPTQTNGAPQTAAPYQPYRAPNPVAPDGNLGYYNARNKDFVQRYKDVPGLMPPDYYLSYGAKYADRFSNETANRLTDEGKAWLVRARINLQVAMEEKLRAGPEAYDTLEKNQDAFRDFAFSTHADAYWTAGLGDLGPADLANIALTPDIRDLLSKSGLLQVDDIGGRLLSELGGDIVDLIAGEGTANEVKTTALNLYKDAKEELDLKFGDGTAKELEDIVKSIDNIASDIAMTTFDGIYAVESTIIKTEANVIDTILGEPHDPNHPERHGPVERAADKLRNKLQDLADWVEKKL